MDISAELSMRREASHHHLQWSRAGRLLLGMFQNKSSQLMTKKWGESLRKTGTREMSP